MNADDAVLAKLQPSEDYKTSVLSGLSPALIMECAGRALAFYSYQAAQEVIYQDFLARSLTDKYANLSTEMDKIIHDANAEIVNLRDKLSIMHVEQKTLEQKNYDLENQIKLKSKTQQQLHAVYNRLKNQAMGPNIEMAAQRDAEQVLYAAGVGHSRGKAMHSRGSAGSGGSAGQSRTIQAWEQHGRGSRHGMQTSHSAPFTTGTVPSTPSATRQRMQVRMPPLYGNSGTATRTAVDRETFQHPGSVQRSNSYSPLDQSGVRHGMGYGMRAGVKMGRQQNGLINRNGLMR
ncbi:hypothetical protein LTR62_000586 [Meristemomyces frigidus]|uniref:Uncharacterized protein n=1 Tax=Meristemomyces frigidus TaxID=1508187 RepID=A0AAN7T997_9PEZI|nr:hypothetical protein LTR62_000586 [Meristemomyces frigidus]